MPYISDLLGKPVTDVDGVSVGRLTDVVATVRPSAHPLLRAIVVRRGGGPLVIPMADVAVLVAPAIPLSRRLNQITPYQPGEHDVYLARDVLDKQIIDTNGVRVVRVNDLELAHVSGQFYVSNVDMGGLGLLRRLGLEPAARRVIARMGREAPSGAISWDHVELLPGNQPIRLKVAARNMAELNPVDLADIISDLSRAESGQLLGALDVKTVADTLEEVEPEFQASLVESMTDEKIADVLQEMAPDEAADLLAEFPDERSEELLNLMEDADAAGVRRLLAYPEESAGGIMNTEYATVGPDLSAAEVMKYLRETTREAETIYYVYVVEESNRLAGVFSLRELVLAAPETLVRDFMHSRVVSVHLEDSQDEVARMVARYNLLAVPVVDDESHLQGIVTMEDALDKIIPTAWKKRLPRMYR